MPFPDTPLRSTPRRRVVLTRHVQNQFPPIAYRVGIEGEAATYVTWRYAKAWRHARQRARELHVALEDRTIEPTVMREPDRVDEPLWERLRRTVSRSEPAGDPPDGCRGQWAAAVTGGWVGEVPPTGLTPAQLWTQVALVVTLTALTALVVWVSLDGGPPEPARLALAVLAGALPAVPAAGLGAVLLQGLLERHTVRIAPEGLTVTRQLGPFESPSFVAWDDVEDLVITHDPVGAEGTLFRLPGPAVLVVRMAERHVLVGDGLTPTELIWLRGAIVALITNA